MFNFNFNELRDAVLADLQPLRDVLDSLKRMDKSIRPEKEIALLESYIDNKLTQLIKLDVKTPYGRG